MGGYKGGKTPKVKLPKAKKPKLPDDPFNEQLAQWHTDHQPDWAPAVLAANVGWDKVALSDAEFGTKAAAADQYLAAVSAAVAGNPDPTAQAQLQVAQAQVNDLYSTLEPTMLHDLAETAGFATSPYLVDPDTLAVWLSPATDPDTKQAISAASLAALADLQAGHASAALTSEPVWIGHQPWPATTEDLHDLLATIEGPDDIVGVWWVNQQALLAVGPDQAQIDHVLDLASNMTSDVDIPKHLDTDQTARFAALFGVDQADVQLLTGTELRLLADPHTDVGTAQQLIDKLDSRKDTVEQLNALAWDSPGDAAKLMDTWTQAAKLLHSSDLDGKQATKAGVPSYLIPPATVEAFTATASGWSAGQLEQAAVLAGADEQAASAASKTTLINYLHATVHQTDNPDGFHDAAAALAAAGPVATAKGAAQAGAKASGAAAGDAGPGVKPAEAPASTAESAASTVGTVAAIGRRLKPAATSKMIGALRDGLRRRTLAQKAVPSYLPAADLPPLQQVGPATGTLGSGSHTAFVATDDAGSAWLCKPYSHSGGSTLSRVQTEATAAHLKAAVNPAIPVYVREVNGVPMAAQPVLDGTSQPNPKNLSQADVDTVIEGQVGDWLIGDHDGHVGNWLRTQSGALVRCDVGQAWKFAGNAAETLDPGWDPNAKYNQVPPLFKLLLRQHKEGKLPPGTKIDPAVVLPAIRKAEGLSDEQLAAQVRPAAKAGAADPNSTWREPMRKAAAARTGKPASKVTADDVADQMVEHVLQRRRSLRDDFRRVFADAGVDPSALDVT